MLANLLTVLRNFTERYVPDKCSFNVQDDYVKIYKNVLQVHSHTGIILLMSVFNCFCVTSLPFLPLNLFIHVYQTTIRCLLFKNLQERWIIFLFVSLRNEGGIQARVYRGLVSLSHCYNRVNNLLSQCSHKHALIHSVQILVYFNAC